MLRVHTTPETVCTRAELLTLKRFCKPYFLKMNFEDTKKLIALGVISISAVASKS